MSQLTNQQRKRIEENRLKALERRAAALCKTAVTPNNLISNAQNKFRCCASKKYGLPPRTSNNGWNFSFRKKSKIENLDSKHRYRLKQIGRYYKNKYKKSPKLKEKVDFRVEPRDINCSTGTCVMLNRFRFYVDVSYHNKELEEIFKSIPSFQFDTETKKWNFLLKDHDKLMASSKTLNNVLLLPLPRLILKTFGSATEKRVVEKHDLSSLHRELLDALLLFQIEGVNFGIQKGGRVLIADDMGLGKTIQAIAIVDYFKDWPLLVVAPSSVRYTWEAAFDRWLPSTDPDQVTVIETGRDPIPEYAKIVVISYDLLTVKKDDVVRRKFGSVILDESHFLKNFRTNRAKAAREVTVNVKRIIMLSGTPALSRPMELYAQLSFLMRGDFLSYREFGSRYCQGQTSTDCWEEFQGASKLEELQLLLEETVMIRRLKSDVAKQLPSKIRQVVLLDSVDTGDTQLQKWKARTGFRGTCYEKYMKRGPMVRFFDRTGIVKLRAVCEHVTHLLATDDRKFLCFAHHQAVLGGIRQVVEAAGVDSVYIDGSVTSERRMKLCDRFQTEATCRVAVLSITAAGCGVTLNAASLVVFAELFWNPGILTQAEDRAHRIGQENSVVVQYLVARGTADDVIWPLVQKKLGVLTEMGLGYDEGFKSLAVEIVGDADDLMLEDFFNDVDFSGDDDEHNEKRLKTDS